MRDLTLYPHFEQGLLCCGEIVFIWDGYLCKIEDSAEEADFVFDIYRNDDMDHYIPLDGGFFDGNAKDCIDFVMQIIDDRPE